MKRDPLIQARGSKTQVFVSKEIGISQKLLSKLETGAGNPSIKTAIRIAAYYDKKIDELFPDLTNQTN